MDNTTNVHPEDLNYTSDTPAEYDRQIMASVPYYRQIYRLLKNEILGKFDRHSQLKVLDLGTGTGNTALAVREKLPNAQLTLVDFSSVMLEGARKKVGDDGVTYLCGDYSGIDFGLEEYDLVTAFLGVHHQNDAGKRRVFGKVAQCLKPSGMFAFADLVTYRDQKRAALNHARHYQHLGDNMPNDAELTEWAHHHWFLNLLSPVEDQLEWLVAAGFSKVDALFTGFNTALILAER